MPTSHAFSIRANDIRLCRKREGKIRLMKIADGVQPVFVALDWKARWRLAKRVVPSFWRHQFQTLAVRLCLSAD